MMILIRFSKLTPSMTFSKETKIGKLFLDDMHARTSNIDHP